MSLNISKTPFPPSYQIFILSLIKYFGTICGNIPKVNVLKFMKKKKIF